MLSLFVRRFDLDSVRDSVTCGQRLAFFGHFIRKEVGDGAAGVGRSHLGRQRWMMEYIYIYIYIYIHEKQIV